MNAMVAVRANSTGLQNQPPAERVKAAREVASTVQAKSKAALKAAGVTGYESEATGDRVVKKELDRDAFLQLLVLQMQNQDPLEPVENTEMIAQLAQFSALEQMTNLNSSFEKLSSDFSQLSFVTAGGLVGRTVSGQDADGILREGKVERAIFEQGSVYLLVGGGRVPLANLTNVE